ncbi:hypothetical protein [Nocardia carnea]|uniref:hypothetical protein n=1 Tax=Nocardia carnea TaxID=37328 RepID=UPI002457E77B|nr:hypothetical protein [Nocardia carnea]
MSWRDNAPEAVQADLDGLLNSAISLAEKKLSERGEFFPFGMAVEIGGGMRMVEAGAGTAQAAWEMNLQALRGMRGEIRAAALVVDVLLPETDSSGIQVHLEHVDGPAIGVLEPYTLAGTEVSALPLEGFTAQRAVW